MNSLADNRGRLGQLFSVVCIALGTGLLVAGISLNPELDLERGAQEIARFQFSSRDAEFLHAMSATLKGFGAAFLVFGILWLIVPWINASVHAPREAHSATLPSERTP